MSITSCSFCPCPSLKPFESLDSNDLLALSEEGFGLAFELLELGRIIFSDKYLKLAFKPRDELDRNDLILLDKDLLDDLDDEEFDEDLVKIEELLVKEEEVLETFLGSSSSGNS